MTLPMHSPAAREKIRDTKMEKLKASLNPKQRAAYERWVRKSREQGTPLDPEAHYDILRDLHDDVTMR